MRQVFFALFLSSILLSCKREPTILPEKKIASVLADLHLAEAFGQTMPIDSGGYMIKRRDSILDYYQYIYDHHNISQKELQQSLDWYCLHPEEFEKVYEKVLARLSTIKEKDIPKGNIDTL